MVYNYNPHPPKQVLKEQPQNIPQNNLVDESPFNVSRVLKAKQQ